MKYHKLFIILFCILLSGCSSSNTANERNSNSISETSISSVFFTNSKTEQSVLYENIEEITTSQIEQTTIPASETEAITTSQIEQTTIPTSETEAITISQIEQTTIPTSETEAITTSQIEQTIIPASETEAIELTHASDPSKKYSVYTDLNDSKKYIVVSVTPIKEYWNCTDKSIPIEEKINIYLPFELYAIVSNAESLLIYFEESDITYPVTFSDNVPQVSLGKRKIVTLYSDFILPVKNGQINMYTNEDLLSPYEFVDNSSFLFSANNITKYIKFYNNISEKDFDNFLSEVEKNYMELVNIRNNTPELEVEPFSFESYWNKGIYLKASVNQVY